jgi:hypothetical protein
LSAQWTRDRLFVSVLSPENRTLPDTLYLIAHTRGLLQYAERWDNSRSSALFPVEQVPSGVLHLLLLDAHMMTLSERLVFVNNDDQAQTDYLPDKPDYGKRSLVRNKVKLTDKNGQSLKGSFSVAITDDSEVLTDTTRNILTHLLLSSDLRGHIEDPAFYFREGNDSRVWELDMLMLTQGWRRYDVPQVIQGKIATPSAYLEAGAEISGTVIKMLVDKPAEKAVVTIIASNGVSFDVTETDTDGHFYFRNCELPDSTQFLIQARPEKPKSKIRLKLIVDKDDYPEVMEKPLVPVIPDRTLFVRYADKTEQKYVEENGERMIQIQEVVVRAKRDPLPHYSGALISDYIMSEEQIKQVDETYIEDVFRNIPGAVLNGDQLTIFSLPVILYVDDWALSLQEVIMFIPDEIKQIEVLTGYTPSGEEQKVISIRTKHGIQNVSRRVFHTKSVTPLGYQFPAEFYAPKYDTPEAMENIIPDLRTTIHWQPDVSTDSEGVAAFEFYTADAETIYTVIIEGVASNGAIIRKEGKIMRNAK